MNAADDSPSIRTSQTSPSTRKYSLIGIFAFILGLWNAFSFGMVFIILQFLHEIDILLLFQGLLQICLTILPFIGVILGIIAVIVDVAQKNQRKIFSIIGLILNFLVMVGFISTLVLAFLSLNGPL